MYRTDHPTGLTIVPTPTAPSGTPDRYFAGGDPVTGTGGTIVEAEWLNMVQEELTNAVIAGGLVPNKGDRAQLSQAIRNIASGLPPPDLSGYVLKTGDTMSGGLQTPAIVTDYTQFSIGDSSFRMSSDASYNVFSFAGDWSWLYEKATGALTWQQFGGTYISFAPGGNLIASGNVSGQNLYAVNAVDANYISSRTSIDAAGNVSGNGLYANGILSVAGVGDVRGAKFVVTDNPGWGYASLCAHMPGVYAGGLWVDGQPRIHIGAMDGDGSVQGNPDISIIPGAAVILTRESTVQRALHVQGRVMYLSDITGGSNGAILSMGLPNQTSDIIADYQYFGWSVFGGPGPGMQLTVGGLYVYGTIGSSAVLSAPNIPVGLVERLAEVETRLQALDGRTVTYQEPTILPA
jgi:hypothetical protein